MALGSFNRFERSDAKIAIALHRTRGMNRPAVAYECHVAFLPTESVFVSMVRSYDAAYASCSFLIHSVMQRPLENERDFMASTRGVEAFRLHSAGYRCAGQWGGSD